MSQRRQASIFADGWEDKEGIKFNIQYTQKDVCDSNSYPSLKYVKILAMYEKLK